MHKQNWRLQSMYLRSNPLCAHVCMQEEAMYAQVQAESLRSMEEQEQEGGKQYVNMLYGWVERPLLFLL